MWKHVRGRKKFFRTYTPSNANAITMSETKRRSAWERVLEELFVWYAQRIHMDGNRWNGNYFSSVAACMFLFMCMCGKHFYGNRSDTYKIHIARNIRRERASQTRCWRKIRRERLSCALDYIATTTLQQSHCSHTTTKKTLLFVLCSKYGVSHLVSVVCLERKKTVWTKTVIRIREIISNRRCRYKFDPSLSISNPICRRQCSGGIKGTFVGRRSTA